MSKESILIISIVAIFSVIFLSAFILNKLGKKFNIGSFVGFLLPIYNIVLLCDCAKISRLFVVGLLLPGLVGSVMEMKVLEVSAQIISVVMWIYLWGKIAERLKKNFWMWGLGSVFLLGIPVVIMAFDNSKPIQE